MNDRKEILAHRGFSSRFPENTMLAFQKAVECGADGVEMDVQLTRDGVPVIAHDEDLARTAGNPACIRDLTLAELQAIDVSYRFSAECGFQRVPTLAEYFDLVEKLPFVTNIELKTAYSTYPGIEKKVIDMIHARKLDDRVILSSFNHYTLLRCKQIDPALPCGLLYDCRIIEPQDYAMANGMQYLHPHQLCLDDAELARYADTPIRVNPWTVDEPARIRYFLGRPEIRCIITNKPDLALAVRDGRA